MIAQFVLVPDDIDRWSEGFGYNFPVTSKSPTRTYLPIAIVAAMLIGAGIGWWIQYGASGSRSPGLIEGLLWPPARQLGAFALSDHRGQSFDPQRLSGKWSLLFFGFTHCPDVCPNTLQLLKSVAPQLPADTQVVFVSVDPERDTPEQLADYVTYFHPDFIGVTGTQEAVNALTAQLGVVHMRSADGDAGNYTVDHSASIFLVDPALRLVGLFSPPFAGDALHRHYVNVRQYVEKQK